MKVVIIQIKYLLFRQLTGKYYPDLHSINKVTYKAGPGRKAGVKGASTAAPAQGVAASPRWALARSSPRDRASTGSDPSPLTTYLHLTHIIIVQSCVSYILLSIVMTNRVSHMVRRRWEGTLKRGSMKWVQGRKTVGEPPDRIVISLTST